MANTKSMLALKPYLEQVRSHCQKLSYEELCDLICALVQEIPVRERAGFLEKLIFLTRAEEEVEVVVKADDELISRIDALKEEIAERQQAIEDGSYYEEYGEWDEYSYDEEIEPLSEEQRADLQTLFAEADRLFLANDLESAREAYALLLDVFRADQDDEEFYYQLDARSININWRETRARYCRCVYETSEPEERMTRMFHAMEIDVMMFESQYDPREEHYPLLRDVFEARAAELTDWESFLKAWQHALERDSGNRAVVLFLEAVNWLDGATSVAREVRKRRLPVGYLFWIDLLIVQQAWQEAGSIAQEALEHIPKGKLRAQAADMLSQAGQETGKDGLILQGKREQFVSTPQDETLSALIAEANRQQVGQAELEHALSVLPAMEQTIELRVKILLMLGRLTEASGLVDKSKALGWSYGGTGIGVLFGGVLIALTHADPQGATIQALLRRYAAVSGSYFPGVMLPTETGGHPVIVQAIVQGLQQLTFEDAQKQEWFALAQQIGGDRIDAIVSNQHRNSYRRAAEVLGALMECCLLTNQQPQARLLLDTYRNQKYRRHSAFRSEVDTVLKSSNLLRPFYSKK